MRVLLFLASLSCLSLFAFETSKAIFAPINLGELVLNPEWEKDDELDGQEALAYLLVAGSTHLLRNYWIGTTLNKHGAGNMTLLPPKGKTLFITSYANDYEREAAKELFASMHDSNEDTFIEAHDSIDLKTKLKDLKGPYDRIEFSMHGNSGFLVLADGTRINGELMAKISPNILSPDADVVLNSCLSCYFSTEEKRQKGLETYSNLMASLGATKGKLSGTERIIFFAGDPALLRFVGGLVYDVVLIKDLVKAYRLRRGPVLGLTKPHVIFERDEKGQLVRKDCSSSLKESP